MANDPKPGKLTLADLTFPTGGQIYPPAGWAAHKKIEYEMAFGLDKLKAE